MPSVEVTASGVLDVEHRDIVGLEDPTLRDDIGAGGTGRRGEHRDEPRAVDLGEVGSVEWARNVAGDLGGRVAGAASSDDDGGREGREDDRGGNRETHQVLIHSPVLAA